MYITGYKVIEISSDSEEEDLLREPSKIDKKNVFEEVIDKLLTENRNLKLHVEALQRRVLSNQSNFGYPWQPNASSTMKINRDDSEKENSP